RAKTGKKLNLVKPSTFNEKIQWLKLNDKNPRYISLVDKYDVRKYVKNTIGEEYLIKLYGVYSKFSDINFDTLPDKFVIKCTHDSASTTICKDKGKLNKDKLERYYNKKMSKNF